MNALVSFAVAVRLPKEGHNERESLWCEHISKLIVNIHST
jgi:hypothetical protein